MICALADPRYQYLCSYAPILVPRGSCRFRTHIEIVIEINIDIVIEIIEIRYYTVKYLFHFLAIIYTKEVKEEVVANWDPDQTRSTARV